MRLTQTGWQTSINAWLHPAVKITSVKKTRLIEINDKHHGKYLTTEEEIQGKIAAKIFCLARLAAFAR